MKVVFRNKLNPAWHDAIAELALDLPEAELIFDPAEAKRQTPEADVLVGGVFEPDELEQAGALKAVIVPFAGVNKLPLRLLARKKVRVANSHGNASTVAERGLAMILAFYTRLIPFHNDLAEGVWRGHRGKLAGTLDDTWDSIRDKTCCLVGLGAIGFELSKLLAAFGCRILAWRKRTGRPKPEWVEQVSADLDWVLSQSDIVCLTLALTPETKGLFSREWLMNMHNKFLLNVSRADLVDEKGLYDSLDQGVLKGAGLDVWYQYPEEGSGTGEPSRYPIHKLPNVVLSPHACGFNLYSVRQNIKFTLDQIRAFVLNGELLSEVDPDLGY